jgi:hypothetical protein
MSRHIRANGVDIDLLVVLLVGGAVACVVGVAVTIACLLLRRRARLAALVSGDHIDMQSLMETPMLLDDSIVMPSDAGESSGGGGGRKRWDTGILETEDFAIL